MSVFKVVKMKFQFLLSYYFKENETYGHMSDSFLKNFQATQHWSWQDLCDLLLNDLFRVLK